MSREAEGSSGGNAHPTGYGANTRCRRHPEPAPQRSARLATIRPDPRSLPHSPKRELCGAMDDDSQADPIERDQNAAATKQLPVAYRPYNATRRCKPLIITWRIRVRSRPHTPIPTGRRWSGCSICSTTLPDPASAKVMVVDHGRMPTHPRRQKLNLLLNALQSACPQMIGSTAFAGGRHLGPSIDNSLLIHVDGERMMLPLKSLIDPRLVDASAADRPKQRLAAFHDTNSIAS